MNLYVLHEWIAGPLLLCSLLIFVGGMAWRVLAYMRGLGSGRDRVAYAADRGRGLAGALSSVALWLVPFATHGGRADPLAMTGGWLFHAGLITVAIFLPEHGQAMYRAFGAYSPWAELWPKLPEQVADALTLMALAGGSLLVLRRLLRAPVRFLTTWKDWLVLGLCLAVLATGMLSHMQGPWDSAWLDIHMLCGEAILIMTPFTRLSHMVLYFLSRGQLGLDYAVKRGGATRGPFFPW